MRVCLRLSGHKAERDRESNESDLEVVYQTVETVHREITLLQNCQTGYYNTSKDQWIDIGGEVGLDIGNLTVPDRQLQK